MIKGLSYIRYLIKIQEERINEFSILGFDMKNAKDCLAKLKEIEKSLMALQIIKTYSYYDIHLFNYMLSEKQINCEEYHLLKEVLL